MLLNELFEISANPDYLRAAERSRSQARDTQRQYWRSPEEKAAARSTEIKRDKGIGGYTKRHRAANPDAYPTPKAQPAPKLRDPSTEYSDDYSVWAAGRRDTQEQGVAEGSREQVDPNTVWEVSFDYGPHQSDKVKVRASSQEEAEQKGMRAAKKLGHRFPQLNWAMPVEQDVAEMDKSQPSHGRDGRVSHSTYGSRDRGGSTGPERTAKATTADKMMKDAHDAMMRSMSDADKVKKGWRNPNM